MLVLYHRASTFGGSFNSVLDVLHRVDRSRFQPVGALPGHGTCETALESVGVPALTASEQAGSRSLRYLRSVAAWVVRLRTHRIELLYIADHVTWRSSALAAARMSGVPTVVHVRSPLAVEPIDPELTKATVIIGNSAASVRAIESARPPGSTRVVYNFVDFQKFAAGKDVREALFRTHPLIVGFVGVFRPEKGIEYFLEMAAMLRKTRPEVRFLAVGGESSGQDVGWFPRMKAYAEGLGLSDSIVFTGARGDVPDLMKSIDVLVVPSLNEGFGRVILEANAAGVPVVGANAAGIPEVIEDGVTGILVPPRDSAALHDAVLRVIDDPVWRHRFPATAPGWARTRFDPDVQMARLSDAWDDAIATKRRL
jgi:glycosyltransferase involved in cell wall biosynthesis